METGADYHAAMTLLFREAFEGRPEGQDYTWFVEGKEGIFDAFERIDASAASKRLGPSSPTIFAHLNHVRYALWLSHCYIKGQTPASDWEGSWAKQDCSEDEWEELAQDVRSEYEGVVGFFDQRPAWPQQDWLLGAMALLPHMAYHLGAIRQLMKLV